ncbi:hypothetical protein CBS147337_10352 [Penicillium roqueforti]|nr:hypothetical protein CBS147337_10352 [Penicillium roqueforti]
MRTDSAGRRVNNNTATRIWNDLTAFAVALDQPPLAKTPWTGASMPTVLALETRRCVPIHDVRELTLFDILTRQVVQPAIFIILADLFTCCATDVPVFMDTAIVERVCIPV